MPWSTSDRRARLPADWAARRRVVLTRDGWRCTWMDSGTRCSAQATDVDHVRRGDDHSMVNLTSLCRDHHKIKTNDEARQARQAQRAKLRLPTERHPGLL